MEPSSIGVEFEKNLSKLIGAVRNFGSGNVWYKKGDCQTENVLIECKSTASKQYILKLAELKKIQAEANKARKFSLFAVNFSKENETYLIVRLDEILDGI